MKISIQIIFNLIGMVTDIDFMTQEQIFTEVMDMT